MPDALAERRAAYENLRDICERMDEGDESQWRQEINSALAALDRLDQEGKP